MKTQTKDEPKKEERRDSDLENIIGNLLITEFQAERLREKVISHIKEEWIVEGDNIIPPRDVSVFPFIYKGELYKIYINVKKPKIIANKDLK